MNYADEQDEYVADLVIGTIIVGEFCVFPSYSKIIFWHDDKLYTDI